MKSIKTKSLAYLLMLFVLAAALTACGGGGGSSTTTTVANSPPVASDIATTLNEGGTASIDIAANVDDPESALDLASITVITSPPNGSLVINADGTVAYTHNGSETLSDSFTYTMDDVSGASSNEATVSLSITAVNDAPTISGSPATGVGEGGLYSFTPTAGDAENDTLSFSISGQPTWSSFGPTTGALTGTPPLGTGGTSSTTGIIITVTDQNNSSASLPPFDISVLQGFNQALFADPTVSSSTKPERQYQANDGIIAVGNGWVAGEDVLTETAWIRLTFDSTKTIYRVALTGVIDLIEEHLQAGSIEFSDGSSITISTPLPIDGTAEEFVFSPKQTDWIQINLTQAETFYGLAEIAAYTTLDPGQTKLFEDLFSDGVSPPVGWTQDDAGCGLHSAIWEVLTGKIDNTNNTYQQSGDCGSYSADGVARGSIALNDNPISAANVDIRLRLRSLDPSTDSTATNDASGLRFNTIGLVFGYQDTDNFYRVDLNGAKGHRKLWRKQAGLFTELNVSPQSYVREQWSNLRVVSQNGKILVFIDGQQVLAAEAAVPTGQMGLFCAIDAACNFDNVVVTVNPSEPRLGLNLPDSSVPTHASSEYFVTTGNSLDVAAFSTETTGIGGVEFVLDEGLAGEISQTDLVAPYMTQFIGMAAGDHSVAGYLLDTSGIRLATSEATVSLAQIGTEGIHLLAMGDSITNGQQDDVTFDDVSSDSRNTGGGYAPILNDHLTTGNGASVTVRNEGNHGELAAEGAARVDVLLSRNPEAQAFLVFFGANDSGDPTPSGLGLLPGDPGYDGSFKDSIQQIIDAVQGAGKVIFLIKTTPYILNAPRDAIVQVYNQVIDELVTENGLGYTPADLHTLILAEMDADGVHPNGTGYAEVARLICGQLTGQMGLTCIP